jgi:hypothetical protein
MKITFLAGIGLALQLVAGPVWSADDVSIERMATCKDSWLDWKKDDPAKLKSFGDHIGSGFSQKDNDPFLVPSSNTSIAGLHVSQLFPDNVGMGVGFSVTVNAPFDEARRKFETILGKPLTKCDTGDGMRTCGLDIAEKRTFMLMAEDSPKATTTLVGCYYFYEK